MISTAKILYTKNYKLRIPDESDIDFVFSASRYPGFNDGMQWEPPIDKSELLIPIESGLASWKAGTAYSFTVESIKAPHQRLGRASIRLLDKAVSCWDVGYWVHPEQQGKGIMTEALAAILTFGFDELHAQEIRAGYAVWNKASEKVLLNNGFKFLRFKEKGFQKKGEWISENELVLTKEMWIG